MGDGVWYRLHLFSDTNQDDKLFTIFMVDNDQRASINKNMLQGSLGYYINPLVDVLFGVLFLKERLRPAQVWTFIMIWTALIIYSTDSVIYFRNAHLLIILLSAFCLAP